MPVNPEKYSYRLPHGTNGGYTNWECRCVECRKAHALAKRRAKMSTIDSKAIIDEIILKDGWYHPDDPRVFEIVEYTNAWGNKTYGVTWENEPNHLKTRYRFETEYIINPKVIWSQDIYAVR